MIEENPQEFTRKLKEQTEKVKSKMDDIIDLVLTSTPEAAWPDDEAPVAGDPGFSPAFLNNRNQGLLKLREAYDLIEKSLTYYYPPNLASNNSVPDQTLSCRNGNRQQVYEEHPEFRPPPPDATLWRYMGFTKFVTLLDRKALFFSRIDRLGDPFEGSYSPVNIETRPQYFLDQGVDPEQIPHILASFTHGVGPLIRKTLVNCWHENDGESEAMWKLYGKDSGIAIKTTFTGLSQCFKCETKMHIGRINYVDYKNTFIGEGNLLTPAMTKRKSFEHEREVRVVASVIDHEYEFGTYFNVDLGSLIKEIVIAPDSPEWFVNLVQSVTTQYNLEVPISKSDMDTNPVW